MNENVKKIFEMLGVEPNEIFKLDNSASVYLIDENLVVKVSPPHGTRIKSEVTVTDILQGFCIIEKLPQKTKRDLLLEEMLQQDEEYYLLSNAERTNYVAELGTREKRLLQGNCGTKEEMEYLREKRQVEAEVRFMMKKYPDREWNNCNQHWFLNYDYADKCICKEYAIFHKYTEYVFPTQESLQEMIEIVGEKRYLKYILRIEVEE